MYIPKGLINAAIIRQSFV